MAAGPRLTVMNQDAVMSKLAEIRVQGRFILASTLREMAERIYDESQFWVPVDTGALKDSGRVEEVETPRFGSSGEWRVVYGSEEVINPKSGHPTSEYALVVHETHHSQPKFIEGPAEAIFSELAAVAGAKFRFLGRGGVVAIGGTTF